MLSQPGVIASHDALETNNSTKFGSIVHPAENRPNISEAELSSQTQTIFGTSAANESINIDVQRAYSQQMTQSLNYGNSKERIQKRLKERIRLNRSGNLNSINDRFKMGKVQNKNYISC